MGRLTPVILATWLAFTAMAEAAPSCETLRANWKNYYYDAFKIRWGSKDNLDCPRGESAAAEAFYHMHSPQFPANAPNFYQLSAGLIRESYYDPNCTEHNAYAQRELGRITFCKPFFDSPQTEYNTSTVVHEARHLHAADPGHVTCNKGRYNGQVQRCDTSFHIDGTGGAFSWDVYYWAWIKNASRHELSNWVLQSNINERVPDRFNQITAEEVKRWRQE